MSHLRLHISRLTASFSPFPTNPSAPSPSVPLDARPSSRAHSFHVSHPSLSLLLPTSSLTICILFHLSFLSPLTASSYPHFFSLSFPDLLSCLWVVGLHGPCYRAPIQTSLSWEARQARWATGRQMTKVDQRWGQTDSLGATAARLTGTGKGKKINNWTKDIQRGSTETLKRVVWQEDRDAVS